MYILIFCGHRFCLCFALISQHFPVDILVNLHNKLTLTSKRKAKILIGLEGIFYFILFWIMWNQQQILRTFHRAVIALTTFQKILTDLMDHLGSTISLVRGRLHCHIYRISAKILKER